MVCRKWSTVLLHASDIELTFAISIIKTSHSLSGTRRPTGTAEKVRLSGLPDSDFRALGTSVSRLDVNQSHSLIPLYSWAPDSTLNSNHQPLSSKSTGLNNEEVIKASSLLRPDKVSYT
jgi:hypothetical protein